MSDLVLYTHPMSRGRIARWMLEEVGQLYRTEVLEYGTTMKAPAYLAINPMGKVPAVRHGEAVVTEAAAICAYLADAFPEAGLVPAPGSPERAAYYRWLFFAAGPVEAAVVNKALGVVVPPERKPMGGYGSLDEVLDALEGAFEPRRPHPRREIQRRRRLRRLAARLGHDVRDDRQAPDLRALLRPAVGSARRAACAGAR